MLGRAKLAVSVVLLWTLRGGLEVRRLAKKASPKLYSASDRLSFTPNASYAGRDDARE